nr:uncharacterized protein LOC125907282 [Anopheles coluzzii]
MGVSILSIVELVYYCTLKPLIARTRSGIDRAETARVVKSTLILPPPEYGLAGDIRIRKASTNKW